MASLNCLARARVIGPWGRTIGSLLDLGALRSVIVSKVLLVVYAIIKMHETDRVWRQFRFRQSIPVAPQDLDNLHPIELRRLDENWLYVSSYSGAYSNLIIFTQEPYIPLHFSASNPMPGWTFRHLSPMYYMPIPSTFLMTTIPTTTYRPSLFQELTESPLVILLVYRTKPS
ncbi:hypothetical protein Gotri_014979 [Gossypium trilobum]|uniref:Uncharacterized protein n=1 Tax=Gossypium trilobum TaxID=34281 RepID=A0A7J9DYK5_9ROSI|nr:hypothetical protein [Gossypium trilobum]